jgi:hypothetical protein
MTGSSDFLDFGFVLWLIPEPASENLIQEEINNLAQQLGGPVFRPHLTLVTHIEKREPAVLELFQEKLKLLSEIDLEFIKVSTRNTYFQSVFLQASSTSFIMNLNIELRKMFEVEGTHFFNPHLSLFYGVLSAPKFKIASRLLSTTLPIKIRFDRIECHRIEGSMSSWKKISSQPLCSDSKN